MKYRISNACKAAETLYNQHVSWSTSLDYTEKSEKLLDKTLTAYMHVLKELRRMGVGGISINGTFRNLND